MAYITYVDFNPVRIGMTHSPENSEYTSIEDRVEHWEKHLDTPQYHNEQPTQLLPFT